MTGIEETMKNAAAKDQAAAQQQQLTKGQLESKVKAFSNWITVVSAGTYRGHECIHIAGLLNLLQGEHQAALAEYEQMSLKHPDWGRPSDMPPAPGQPVEGKA